MTLRIRPPKGRLASSTVIDWPVAEGNLTRYIGAHPEQSSASLNECRHRGGTLTHMDNSGAFVYWTHDEGRITYMMDKPRDLVATSLPNHAGISYRDILANLHKWIEPETYLEIGTEAGHTLALASCRSLSIDPSYKITDPTIVRKLFDLPACALYQMESDKFFKQFDPCRILGKPIDFAFLDGMHLCEVLLRDFINVERACHKGSIVALHDCFPLEAPMATRKFGAPSINPNFAGWWTGDVWRTALLIRRRRPDLQLLSVDAIPTGLIIISGCDPNSRQLADQYDDCVNEMMSWNLDEIGIAAFNEEMGLQSTEVLVTENKMKTQLAPSRK